MKNPELIIKSLTNEEILTCLKESDYQLSDEGICKIYLRKFYLSNFMEILY
jgi:hypothetical protein